MNGLAPSPVISPIYKLDLADRKEIVVSLLKRLSIAAQMDFLQWCTRQLPPIFAGTRIEGELSGAGETWLLFIMLVTQHGLDFVEARLELERRVRFATGPRERQRRWLR